MAQWAQAQQLTGDALQQIQSIYGDHFPIEVRHFLASWLEEKMCSDFESPQRDQYVVELFNAFIVELQEKTNALSTADLFLAKMKLREAAVMFQERYSNNPYGLFRIIRHCLHTEYNLVRQNEAGMTGPYGPMGSFVPDPMSELAKQLHYLRTRTHETAEELRVLENEQEAYALSYHESTKLCSQIQTLASQPQSPQIAELEKKIQRNKDLLDQTLQQKVASLVQMRLTLVDKLSDTIANLSTLQSRVLEDELIRWKREQQLAGNGAHFISNLDNIQEWCESLAEIIWLNRQQVKELEGIRQKIRLDPPGMVDLLPALNTRITALLSSLITSTFIIEKQPPQVMKTNTRFTATVRLLVGGKLNVHMSPPQVKVSIISEAQANAMLQNDRSVRPNDPQAMRNEGSGEILNCTGRMDYVPQTRQLTVQFRNMQLKKIKRAEKKGTESVMDEKFSLLFQTQFSVGGGELVYHVWTLSLPVVVIVHGNQEPHAWATVTWDNAFAEPGRTPFAVPDKVPWAQVADALNCKFQSVTGRRLTESNLRFLAEKAFRVNQGVDFAQIPLSWSLFCKEPLPDRTFTFWEWFYAVMKLTKEHLKGPWADGSIIGFIRKNEAEEMLAGRPVGTFLLRFSDSEPGGIVIAWVGEQNEIFMLHPFTSKDFVIRSMADRILDLQQLIYLYPDIPKDSVFGKYYSPPVVEDNAKGGYVKPVLVTQVPGHTYSTPNTPQTMHQPLSPETAPRAHIIEAESDLDLYPSVFPNDEEFELGLEMDHVFDYKPF